MSITVYLSGHRSFSNRGCEAIVRGTVKILNQAFDQVNVLVPSMDVERDRMQWPEAESQGVTFVPSPPMGLGLRVWRKATQRSVLLGTVTRPFPLPSAIRADMQRADVILAVGGDNYSEDYGLPTAFLQQDRAGVRMGKPVILWGASIGPFKSSGRLKRVMARHLASMTGVFARELYSEQYCQEELALGNVFRFADPAFCLTPEAPDLPPDLMEALESGSAFGCNISPLILRKLDDEELFLRELVAFLKDSQTRHGLPIILVPHVMYPNPAQNDRVTLEHLQRRLATEGVEAHLLSERMNAANLKWVISKCRAFMGARTHSTIASMGSGVPTISLGYSVKSRGINRALFGHEEFNLYFRTATRDDMREALDRVLTEEDAIRAHLQDTLPEVRASSLAAGSQLRELIGA